MKSIEAVIETAKLSNHWVELLRHENITDVPTADICNLAMTYGVDRLWAIALKRQDFAFDYKKVLAITKESNSAQLWSWIVTHPLTSDEVAIKYCEQYKGNNAVLWESLITGRNLPLDKLVYCAKQADTGDVWWALVEVLRAQ